MGGGRNVAGRLALLPLLLAGVGLGIFVPKMLIGATAKSAAPAVHRHKHQAMRPPATRHHRAAVDTSRRVHTQLPVASTAGKSFYQVASEVAHKRFGVHALDGAAIAVSTECASGYAVVIWHNSASLMSSEIYLRDPGSGYQVVSGAYTRYDASGAIAKRIGFGHRPQDISCFDPN